MNDLNSKAIGGLFFLVIVLGLLIFFSAGTINYWQAWTFLAVFFVMTLGVTLYLMKNDRSLLEKRVKAGPSAEKEKNQKYIQFLAQFVFILIIIFPALDYRFEWSPVNGYVSLFGDILVTLGLLFVFFVFKENSFTSATIEVDRKQKVITTGPYSLMRHPMYAGAIIMLIGVPLALGSLLGLLTVIPLTVVIIFRLLDEEKLLAKKLAGYIEYQKRVRYHLIPYIW